MRLQIEKYRFIGSWLLWAFWICAAMPFFIQELTSDFQPRAVTTLNLLCESSVAILGLWVLRARVDKWIIVIYLAVSFFDSVVANKLSLSTWVNGSRLYIGFLFMVPIIRYFWQSEERRHYFVGKMDRLIYLYLVVQFPCMVIQALRYGPWDNVGGSLGWLNSGIVSTLIYLCSFYLMCRRWDPKINYLQNLRANYSLVVLLIPSLLNETKISYIFMVLYFLLLIPADKNFLRTLAVVVPLTLSILGGAVWAYLAMQDEHKMEVADVQSYLIGNDILLDVVEYAFENDVAEVNEGDYARGLKFYLLPEVYSRHEGSWLTGFGVGQYKGGGAMEKTEFAKRYFWMLQGTIMQLQMCLIELGVPGAVLYILYWITMLRLWGKHKETRSKQMSWMLGIMLILVSIYNPPFFSPPFYIIFMYLTFLTSRWTELPPYQRTPILGNLKITWTWQKSA